MTTTVKPELLIKEYEDAQYSLAWTNEIPHEVLIKILDTFVKSCKDRYKEILMGNSKPF